MRRWTLYWRDGDVRDYDRPLDYFDESKHARLERQQFNAVYNLSLLFGAICAGALLLFLGNKVCDLIDHVGKVMP